MELRWLVLHIDINYEAIVLIDEYLVNSEVYWFIDLSVDIVNKIECFIECMLCICCFALTDRLDSAFDNWVSCLVCVKDSAI